MIFDWRPRRYRGGSGWQQPALAVAYVGIISASAPIALLPANIIVATLEAVEVQRTLTSETPIRTLTFDG